MYKYLSSFIILCLFCLTTVAEETMSSKYITLKGIVKDKESHKVLPYATISLPGNNVGTVSNSDGEFIFKVRSLDKEGTIIVSHLGYRTATLSVSEEDIKDGMTVWLSPTSTLLPDVIVSGRDARRLVEEAMSKVDENYSNDNLLLTGFYRETARKKRHFINIAEAVLETNKTPYWSHDVSRDRTRVLKGRKLLSQKQGDTLAVKLLGGPTMGQYLDIVKNPEGLLDEEMLDFFKFEIESVIQVNERQHYVVAFYPQIKTDLALYHGRYFIDMETLTLTRAEFMIDMSDREKATRVILRKKPAGLRFKPIEVSYVIDYKVSGDRSRLNYVRTEIIFKCDWKRKLFSTEYGIVSEMVVTDSRITESNEITRREQFQQDHVLSDDVSLFYDEDFWGAYNIIAPEESLEHAVKKLTKSQIL